MIIMTLKRLVMCKADVELTSIQQTLTKYLLLLSTFCIVSTEWGRLMGILGDQHGAWSGGQAY